MALKSYQSKRRFNDTPEPEGEKPKAREKNAALTFVVQEHHASHLHYDFRLEYQGVLKSWAVPKGPSMDPSDKRLAVQVEDHPLEYGSFEGTIPKGNYGAGKVKIWDRGQWTPHGSAGKGFKEGKLKFTLKGRKLKGDFALVRMGDDPKNWLLIKETRETVPKVGGKRPLASRETLPDFVPPALATRVEHAPEGEEWLHEIKLDGYRLLARKEGKRVTLLSRNELDWTDKAPEIAAAIAKLSAKNLIIDGELVSFDGEGISRFQNLQNFQEEGSQNKLIYVVFDLLHLDGRNIRELPLTERKELLKGVLKGSSRKLSYNPHVVGDGPAAAESACRDQLEGIISKRADAPYLSDRGRSWLKIKCDNRQEFVICGFAPHSSHSKEIGALLLCVAAGKGRFTYAGKVGTGYSDKTRKSLFKLLAASKVTESSVEGLPRERGVVYVRPTHVAQIAFREITSSGLIRQGVFQGLRDDKKPEEVAVETVADAGLTHPERILFPDTGFTKADYARYLSAVSTVMLDDIAGRPLSIVRCPDGLKSACFFQKHLNDSSPDQLKSVGIKNKAGEIERYIVVEDREQLLALAQISALEIHSWNATKPKIEKPDRFVIDLDPDPTLKPSVVIETALLLRSVLGELGFESFARVSGGKGLHVVVPLVPKGGWDAVKEFSKLLVGLLVRDNPSLYTAVSGKDRRKKKIFLDYLRNTRGATSICNYSLRARAEGGVAVPLRWDELTPKLRFNGFTPDDVIERIAAKRYDPWKGYDTIQQSVDAAAIKRLERIAGDLG